MEAAIRRNDACGLSTGCLETRRRRCANANSRHMARVHGHRDAASHAIGGCNGFHRKNRLPNAASHYHWDIHDRSTINIARAIKSPAKWAVELAAGHPKPGIKAVAPQPTLSIESRVPISITRSIAVRAAIETRRGATAAAISALGRLISQAGVVLRPDIAPGEQLIVAILVEFLNF